MTQLHPNYPIGGCDVSFWQTGIDFDVLLDRDIWFIICRASVGTQVDTRYQSHKLGAIGHGLPVGAYHYWMPQYSVDGNCAALIQAQPTRPPMGVWLDLEGKGFTITKRALSEHIYQCLQRLDEHYGAMIGLYARQTWWDYWIDEDYYDLIDAASRPCWVAQYFYEFQPEPTPLPLSWPKPHIWQYSAEQGPYAGQASEFGITGTASLDIDAWLGTEQEFKQFTGVSLPPVEIPMQIRTKTVANVRNAPDLTAASDVGNFDAGKMMNVITKVDAFYKVEIYVHESTIEPVIIPPPPTVPEYYNNSDKEKGYVRDAAPCPEISWLSDIAIPLGEKEQRIIYELNQPGMTPNSFTGFLGVKTAFCNSAGFGKAGDPRANFITGSDLNKPLPKAGKCYIFGGAILHGIEKDGWLLVDTIDVTKPLPSLSEIKARGLYSIARIVNEDGSTFYFPHRGGGLPPYWPLFSYGPAKVQLNNNVQNKPIPYITRK